MLVLNIQDSNRRGHDGGFDSYGSNRYSDGFSSEKSGYGGSERTAYRDERARPSAPAARREDFAQRPREASSSMMPPPSHGPSHGPAHGQSYGQSYRGSGSTYRGRGATTLRGRGASRGGFTRRQDTFASPRSRLVETFRAKKRLLVAKPDFFKSKLQKLRR